MLRLTPSDPTVSRLPLRPLIVLTTLVLAVAAHAEERAISCLGRPVPGFVSLRARQPTAA